MCDSFEWHMQHFGCYCMVYIADKTLSGLCVQDDSTLKDQVVCGIIVYIGSGGSRVIYV